MTGATKSWINRGPVISGTFFHQPRSEIETLETMQEKKVIEIFHNKSILCALCRKKELEQLWCITEEGRELKVSEDKALFTDTISGKDLEEREGIIAALRALAAKREALKESIALSDLWELCLEESESYTLEDLAALYFGSSYSCDERSAMFRLLHQEKLYFRRKDEHYYPQPRDHVEGVLLQRQREDERRRRHGILAENARALYEGKAGAFIAEAQEFIASLKDVAIKKKESPRFKEVSDVLALAGITSPQGPFELLVKAGIWNDHENLLIKEHGVPLSFPPEVERSCEELAAERGTRSFQGYLDYRHVPAVTIDDLKTRDFDDALSIEEVPEGYLVGVHIADITGFIPEGSPPDLEARARGTSVYLPDLKIPMLPGALSEDLASLVEGGTRPALSFFVTFSPGGDVVASRIEKTLIAVTRRLTYDMVDDTYQDALDLARLYDIARVLLQKRIALGALYTPIPRVNVSVDDHYSVSIKLDDPSKPSQVLVSELMILANSVAGEFCVKEGIPAIYRGQPAPEEKIALSEPVTPLMCYQMRRVLKKVTVDVSPQRHSGLGIDSYIQATSPLRRYSDLAMHRQLKSVLEGGPPRYTSEELAALIAETERVIEIAELLERERKTYWILRYLEKQTGREKNAVVLRVHPDKLHVQLSETLLEADCPKPRKMEFAPGEAVIVVPELVWPREGTLRLSYQGRKE
ncbi:MAG: ribonuclease R [Candidatus Eremiobacteraeota bacterium]|nr:ribonuclease R [Candidatus Eremiobacteraeota bacterium]